MKKYFNKTLVVLFIFTMTLVSHASYVIDKEGRVVEDITAPTAMPRVDPNTISDALRIGDSSSQYVKDPRQNIYSNEILDVDSGDTSFNDYIKSLYDNKFYDLIEKYGECTDIRYTVSITNVDEYRYLIIEDKVSDRLRMKVIDNINGDFFAKNGFYKVKGKVYYFDSNGLMVLGPARDERGNYYFFSYETGELID